jgi:hypothetical protein
LKLAARVRESKTGKKFFSLAVTPAEAKPPHHDQQHHDQRSGALASGHDDDIVHHGIDAAPPSDQAARAAPSAPRDADLVVDYRVADGHHPGRPQKFCPPNEVA